MRFPRLAGPFADWPTIDKAAWSKARAAGDPRRPLDLPGLAAHWRPASVDSVVRSYGIFLRYLAGHGLLDALETPAMRVSPDVLLGYRDWLLRRGLASTSITTRFRDLHAILRVMQPDADVSQVLRMSRHCAASEIPSRNKAVRLVSPRLLIATSLQHFAGNCPPGSGPEGRRCACVAVDALMLGFLAARPIRLGNLSRIVLERHLVRRGDLYWCTFTAAETKSRRPMEFHLPAWLTDGLQAYLLYHRPLLLGARESQRLWIARDGSDLVPSSIRYRMEQFTQRALGRRINPHLIRDCVATFIAEEAPEDVAIIAAILGHSSSRSSEKYYIQAGTRSAQTRWLDGLQILRPSADWQIDTDKVKPCAP